MNSTALTIIILFGLPVLCGTVIALAVLLRGGVSAKNKQLEAQETKLLQELHHGLAKMEKRIESLETLLIEHEQITPREPTNPL